MLSSNNFGLSRLKLRQLDICFIRNADSMAVDNGPGYEVRSVNSWDGSRIVGQYFDLDFYNYH